MQSWKYNSELCLFVGTGCFLLYIQHVRSIFESRTNISARTQLERESMLLRSDDALYYSFYKTIVDQPNFNKGYEKLLNYTGIEYPYQVNVIAQFYVLPELVIGYLFLVTTNSLLKFLFNFCVLLLSIDMPIIFCAATTMLQCKSSSIAGVRKIWNEYQQSNSAVICRVKLCSFILNVFGSWAELPS